MPAYFKHILYLLILYMHYNLDQRSHPVHGCTIQLQRMHTKIHVHVVTYLNFSLAANSILRQRLQLRRNTKTGQMNSSEVMHSNEFKM